MLSIVNGSVGRGRCGSVFEPRNNALTHKEAPPAQRPADRVRAPTGRRLGQAQKPALLHEDPVGVGQFGPHFS